MAITTCYHNLGFLGMVLRIIIFRSSQKWKPICTNHRSRTRSYQCHRHSRPNNWIFTPFKRWQKEFIINALLPPIIQGRHNSPQHIYSVFLRTHPPLIHKSNSTINTPSIRYRIYFYHDALFSPTVSTWCKAIKMVLFNIGLN